MASAEKTQGATQEGRSGATRPRVVVGVDASEASRAALRWARDHAVRAGATLEVVHAWNASDEHGWLQTLPPPARPTGVAEEGLATMVEEMLGPDPAVPVHTEVIEGHAAKVLVDAAKGADLLVVGSTGFGGFNGIRLGSVSQRCATHAPCSVVIVRSSTD